MGSNLADERLLVTINVRGSGTLEFINRYCMDVVHGGMYLRTGTCSPPRLGAQVRFRFRLQTGQVVFAGRGQVYWIRRGKEPGVGIRFDSLTPNSVVIRDQMLVLKEKIRLRSAEFQQAPTRPRIRVPPPVRQVQHTPHP